METLSYVLEVGSQEVILTPDARHEFMATTEQVALGYGVSVEAIRKHKERQAEELAEGKHFIVVTDATSSSVTNSHARNLQRQQTLWTKRGIVRLGFFIRSARARLFRDMAEDLVIGAMTANVAAQSGPALISARLIAEATGQTGKAVGTMLKRLNVEPVAHYLEPRCRAAAYLWSLENVQAFFDAREEHYTFRAFMGEVRPGIAPVLRQVARLPKPRVPRAAPTAPPIPNRVQAAQELVQLEQRRAQLLAALA